MKTSIVVYRIMSENEHDDMNVSFQTAMALARMGVIRHDVNELRVIKQDDYTVTVYSYRKA